MAVDTATTIGGLDIAKPAATDLKSEGDDNFRHIKTVLKTAFANVTGAVTATHTELNYVDGVTSAIQTQLDAITAGTGTGTGTLSDVIGSRAEATTYTNSGTTTRWVFVQAISSGASKLTLQGRVNAADVAAFDVTATGANSHRASISFPVPAGVTYIVNISNCTVTYWKELQ